MRFARADDHSGMNGGEVHRRIDESQTWAIDEWGSILGPRSKAQPGEPGRYGSENFAPGFNTGRLDGDDLGERAAQFIAPGTKVDQALDAEVCRKLAVLGRLLPAARHGRQIAAS